MDRHLAKLFAASERAAMSTSGFESIEHTVQLTHEWINELDEALG
jgi:hypothetical protein